MLGRVGVAVATLIDVWRLLRDGSVLSGELGVAGGERDCDRYLLNVLFVVLLPIRSEL